MDINNFIQNLEYKPELPSDKQLNYIRNLQKYRVGVPDFDGTTKKDASEFISKYKDYPNRDFIPSERPVFADDDYPDYDDSDIDCYQEAMYKSLFF